MLIDLPLKVRTAGGVTLQLVRELGRGGQGAVYEVAGSRHAVKLLNQSSPEQSDAWAHRLQVVRRLPLDGLPLARPIDTLVQPHTGYVMDLIEGMVPLGRLASVPNGVSPVEHYRDTGGLRRRLHVLARFAGTLASLHARGLVYQDPSPNNVFVSESATRDRVWLIDTDNLSYASAAGRPVYTARYSAPELRPGSSLRANSLSDAFAFAVIAYEVLALHHPFIGDGLYEADEQEEADALDGSHPWIDHPGDQSNRSTLGIPRTLVFDAALQDYFRWTFVEGLNQRDQRPGQGVWADLLRTAAAATVPCSACTMTYYVDATVERCPWCDETSRPATLHTQVLVDLGNEAGPQAADDDPEPPAINRAELVGVDGEELHLTRGAVLGLVADPDRLMFQLRWEGSRLKIGNHTGMTVELVSPDATSRRSLPDGTVAMLPAAEGQPMWSVRIARPNRPDRWLCFAVHPGGHE